MHVFAPQDVDDADKDEDEEDGWNEEDCEDKQAGFKKKKFYIVFEYSLMFMPIQGSSIYGTHIHMCMICKQNTYTLNHAQVNQIEMELQYSMSRTMEDQSWHSWHCSTFYLPSGLLFMEAVYEYVYKWYLQTYTYCTF